MSSIMELFNITEREIKKKYAEGTIAWVNSTENDRFTDAIKKRDEMISRAIEFNDIELAKSTMIAYKRFVISSVERFKMEKNRASAQKTIEEMKL